MPSLAGQAKDRVRHYRNLAMESYWAARQRRPGFDHAARAYERYSDCRGTQLAASVTYYAFLSFFPLLALAFAAAGYLAEFNVEARQYMDQALSEVLPGLSQDLPIDQIAQARVGAGILGLLGLVYSGVNAVSSLREVLHAIWLKSITDSPNYVVAKLIDTMVMLVFGTVLLFSVALTSVLQTATRWLLNWIDLGEVEVLIIATKAVGLVAAIAVNLLIFLVVFSRLSGTRRSWRLLWRGALLAAVGFEILKALGATLIAGTLGNPVYASFAVLVGLLVWINLVMRLVIFAAAWTATWLPVPPPYQGAVPMQVPAGAAGPPRSATGEGGARHRDAASSPPARAEEKERTARHWSPRTVARRVAVPVTISAGVACAWWLRRRRRLS
ncbi:YihY/virulence factor BrkB family protein [Allosalinactinospora lopnorensis]|uniref:YihY/virulence factor BrkB family protein n=1 Tax=Allosalinactinospora lopnorensis TaxID=1352348 RepID=UPI0006979BD2|nr:YihY/virulence factor BrkB family protein [Allosalinactinospora lopnorensis]